MPSASACEVRIQLWWQPGFLFCPPGRSSSSPHWGRGQQLRPVLGGPAWSLLLQFSNSFVSTCAKPLPPWNARPVLLV